MVSFACIFIEKDLRLLSLWRTHTLSVLVNEGVLEIFIFLMPPCHLTERVIFFFKVKFLATKE